MAMQLMEDMPAMLALFTCGVVGYLAAKRLRQPARVTKQAKIVDELDEGDLVAAQPAKPVARGTLVANDDSCGDQAPAVAARRSPKSRRRPRRQQGTAQAAEEEATAIPALDNVEDAGMWEEADAGPKATSYPEAVEVLAATEEVSPPMSERVAKLLAKKAARKAKKAQDLEKVPGESAPSEEDRAVQAEEKAGQQQQQQAQHVRLDEHRPQQLGYRQQLAEQEEQQELERQQQCEEEGEQTDPEKQELEVEHELAVSADQEEKWEEEELEEEPEAEELEEEWEEKELEEEWEEEELEEEWEGEQEDQELPWHCQDQDLQQRIPVGRGDSAEWEMEFSEGSEEWPAEDVPTPSSAHSGSWQCGSRSPNWKWQKGYWQEAQQQQDGWMMPFDEIITVQSQPAPTGPPVCICQGEAGTFTDGSQVFQPLQSGDGSQLFTDGNQVFMPVCVVMGTPTANEAAVGFPGLPDMPGPSAAPDFEEVEEKDAATTFDPYNPVGFAVPPQVPERMDVWDTCWG